MHTECKLTGGLEVSFSRAYFWLIVCYHPIAESLADNPPNLLEEPVQLETLEGEDVHVL